jgi:hypothetical protein
MVIVTSQGNVASGEDSTFTYYDDNEGITFSFDPFTCEAQVVSD